MCEMKSDILGYTEEELSAAMAYLYRTAQIKYPTLSPWHDDLVEEVLLRVLLNREKGIAVAHVKGYLSGILTHVCNDMLRQKYREQHLQTVMAQTPPELQSSTGTEPAEYTALRRETARLTRLYREVTVRHYFYGHSVEKIAAELDIPKGTVLSRLSKARDTIRKGLETPMEKFTEASYAPKKLCIGIWGSQGMYGEPFSLVRGLIEQNILITAYEKPLSLREIGDRMGVACAYLEPICDSLVAGELMGRTVGGLFYTRCFLQTEKEVYGDTEKQEKLARDMASPIWEIVRDTFLPFVDSSACTGFNGKQKATLVLLKLLQALSNIQNSLDNSDVPENPAERPNGGRWYASGTIFDPTSTDSSYEKYRMSGPVENGFSPQNDGHLAYRVWDCSSAFGEAHVGYGAMPYPMQLSGTFRLLASLANPGCQVPYVQMYENLPRLHELYLIRHKEDGSWALDIPYLSFAHHEICQKAANVMEAKLSALLKPSFQLLHQTHVNKIPTWVDGIPYYRHMGALLAYNPAQLLALVPHLPWEITPGKTPLVYMAYDPKVVC